MNRRAAVFLLLYFAAILYLSLYPWNFVPNHGLRTFRSIPLFSRRMMMDAALNVMFYIPLGAAAFATFRRGAFAFVVALAVGSLVSLAVEWMQFFLPARVASLNDLLCNMGGTFLGASAAFIASSPQFGPRIRGVFSPRILLVLLWLVWQAFLFLPRYGPPIDISQVVAGLLMLVLIALPWQHWAITAFFLAWLAIGELQPYQFLTPPQPFLWLPFESWFTGSADSYYGILFSKLFFFTGILWMERRARIGWIWALAAPGLILALGEFAQCYLPGRTPETTDLVLLAIGAVLLNLAEPHNKSQT